MNLKKVLPCRRFLLILFLVCSTISFFNLFNTTINSSTSSLPHKLTRYLTSEEDNLTEKEHRLLLNLISQRSPCNLLFFGYTPQFLGLARLNARGITAFLEDDEEKMKAVVRQTKGAEVYRVNYPEKASEAYELLRHAREHFGCRHEAIQLLKETGCRLGRIGLPKEVYDKKWDVVVIDGPRGDSAEAPGRMSAIYTAAVIARVGNLTDVFVHDVHRMIEKWYSWEFLCQENLISSKGKLWHFRVEGRSRSAKFCPEAKFQIL